MVTENAGQAIEAIVANAEMPDGSGLRIDAPDQPPADARPQRGTAAAGGRQPARRAGPVRQRRRREGVIAPAAAPILDDKVLDVRVE